MREWAGVLRPYLRGTQREYSLKPLKHSIVERILTVDIGIFLSPKNFHLFGFSS